jgi:hypothetical protein
MQLRFRCVTKRRRYQHYLSRARAHTHTHAREHTQFNVKPDFDVAVR